MQTAIVYFCEVGETAAPWILPPVDNEWRRQPMRMLWRCCSGRVRVQTPQGAQVISDGQALHLRRDHFQSLAVEQAPVRFQNLLFECQPMPPLPSLLAIPDGDTVDRCFERLADAYRRGGGRGEAAVVWLRALLDCLVVDHRDRDVQLEGLDRIRACCRAIDAEPAGDWSVAQMAATCGCSPDHFTRQFKRVALVSPRTYITRARIQAAGCRLRESDAPIARIAEELGYGSVFHFSGQFRRHTGMSPSAWRAAARPVPPQRTLADERARRGQAED